MKTKAQSGIALATSLIVLFLIVALVVGFSWMVLMDQRLGGVNGSEQYSFYAAEAGLEKLTGDLGILFNNNPAPSGAQVNAIDVAANTPNLPGIQYVNPNGTLGYTIAFPPDKNGDPEASNHVILSGPYQGMTGLLTPYTLTVTAKNLASNSEVRLTRDVQTVAIPVFQFGMFSQTDLSFFAGPNFNFGGRVHTNGNLFLASGAAAPDGLFFYDKVTAAGQIVRANLSNGHATSSGYTGNVFIPTSAGGCNANPPASTASCRILAATEGSATGTDGAFVPTAPPTWNNLTGNPGGTYNGFLKSSVKPLNLSIVLDGANPIDLIRRPVAGENVTAPATLSERYYNAASIRILLSDNPLDITALPCIDNSVPPTPLGNGITTAPYVFGGTSGNPPIAASGATSGTYNPSNGYWTPSGTPTLGAGLPSGGTPTAGYIKIEIQTTRNPAGCGVWKDVTAQVLGLGYVGRNINPSSYTTWGDSVPPTPGGQIGPPSCTEPSPQAVIRIERLRDNPSNGSSGSLAKECGNISSTKVYDYWPNTLFDTREGNRRDVTPAVNDVSLGGVMDYVELDVANLAAYLTTGGGAAALDASNSSNNFVVYFSDRRGNYTPTAIPIWPPASPSTHETGEYGFEDSINPADPWGCPNGTLDQSETLDEVENSNQVLGGTPEMYGATLTPQILAITPVTNAVSSTITKDPNCSTAPATAVPWKTGAAIWPYMFYTNPVVARENMPLFFRRALKIVDGGSINLGTCPDGSPCGLTIASENPVYIDGDYNAGANGNFGGSHVAASVAGDAVTLLSDNWNDINSFISPYDPTGRGAATTTYRTAIMAGKGISFLQPATCGTSTCYQDFGTDGGAHNFLRFLESWGGQTLYYRGAIASMYYNRQAIGTYKCCTTVYGAPTRGYNFDVEFLTPSLLPPHTPMFRDINTIGFTQTVLPTP